ncbi:MAG: hypothetical protein SGARI_006160 [Bacillariaceae sp.]
MVQDSSSSDSTTTKYVSLNAKDITAQQWLAAEKHLREALQTAVDNPRGKSISGSNKNTKPKGKHKKKKGKQQHSKPSAKSSSDNDDDNPIQTLSAALAAQNLAVVLKSRAMTIDDNDDDDSGTLKNNLFNDAEQLYQQVLDTRLHLLPSKDHPDIYATKYSLAELWHVMGQEDRANALRQEILDTYEPSEEEMEEEEQVPKQVVVEKTQGEQKTE